MNYTKDALASSCINTKNDNENTGYIRKTKYSGFVPSVLSPPDALNPNRAGKSSDFESSQIQRILIISTDSIESDLRDITNFVESSKKPSRTKNRKPVSKKSAVTHNGVEYAVNNSVSYGIFTKVLHRAIEQLEVCQKKWGRVFALRFDLRQKDVVTQNSTMVSRFRKNLMRRLERQYGLHEMGYCWVREQEKAKAQHYHMVIFLDGDRVRHSDNVIEVVKSAWEALNPVNKAGLCRNQFYFVDNEETKHALIKRISYLAKSRGKGYRPPQAKDYSCSRLV